MKNNRVLWASQITPPSVGDSERYEWVDRLTLAYLSLPDINRKKLKATDQELREACLWLLEALYQSTVCLPPALLAIPKSPNAYSQGKVFSPPFGYRFTMDLLLAAGEAGFVKEEIGQWNPNGIGRVSRYTPIGRLRNYFLRIGHCWQKIKPPPKDKLIVISQSSKGKDRRLVSDVERPDIKKMRDNLDRINHLIGKNCIWIDLPDEILLKGSNATQWKLDQAYESDPPELSSMAINFQQVYLRRIFSQTLNQGGRFYGGWWQHIKSHYRSRIFINDFRTTECDFSSLAVRMLYAIEGIDPGEGDMYDLGLTYKNDPIESRKNVKRFFTAVLNDRNKVFRLSNSELKTIGTSHSKLYAALNKKHAAISHYFYSGIGLKLQYIDSKIAEDVMMHFLKRGEVCLPVHDSFIVRQGLESELEKVMLISFKKHLKGIAKVDKESGYHHHALAEIKHTLQSNDLIEVISLHLKDFSIGLSFFRSWEQANYTPEQLLARENQRITHPSQDL